MNIHSKVARLTGVFVFAVVIVYSLVIVDTITVRESAHELIAVLQNKLVGGSSRHAAESALVGFEKYRDKSAPCSIDECILRYRFANKWLHRFAFAPPTLLEVSFEFQRDVLVARTTDFGQGLCCVVHIVERSESSDVFQTDHLISRDSRTGTPVRASFHFASDAPGSDRAKAYSLNLNCLTRINGCHSAEELLPGLANLQSQ